jgi:hypothetical protein
VVGSNSTWFEVKNMGGGNTLCLVCSCFEVPFHVEEGKGRVQFFMLTSGKRKTH